MYAIRSYYGDRTSPADRQECERLTILRDSAVGADRADLQRRLMKISRRADVFDPAFADALPEIYNALRVRAPATEGGIEINLVAEVQ